MKIEYVEPKFNPCPECGSVNLDIDSSSLTTSMLGNDFQSSWIECMDCGYEVCIDAENEETNTLGVDLINLWNNKNQTIIVE